MANNLVLDQLITDLIDHPEHHNQAVWIKSLNPRITSGRSLPAYCIRAAGQDCNTSACAAGWIVLRNIDSAIERNHWVTIPDAAALIADLTPSQASVFFGPSWSTDQVIAGAKFLKDNPDAPGENLAFHMTLA